MLRVFFSKEAITTAEQQISAMHTKFGKDLRVETYVSLPTDRADQYMPEKRTEFLPPGRTSVPKRSAWTA
jgi:hypothetical protein